MDSNKKCKSENYFYDPDIASTIMFVLVALGSLGGIVGYLDHIDRKRGEKKERRFTEKRRKDIELEISYSFRNVSLSTDSISRRLEFLGKICQIPSTNNEKFSDHYISFGNSPIFLNDFQFKAYKNEQNFILKEIVEINNNVFYIEELIADIPYLVDDSDYIINKRLQKKLKETITVINDLMQEFGKITINEFLDRTIQLCRNVEGISNLREDKKNLL